MGDQVAPRMVRRLFADINLQVFVRKLVDKKLQGGNFLSTALPIGGSLCFAVRWFVFASVYLIKTEPSPKTSPLLHL